MTDILLIQPPVRDFYLTAKRTIPYGLASMAAVLLRDGFSVEILDGLATSRSRVITLPEELSYLKEYYQKVDRSSFALFNHFKHFGYSFEHIGKTAKASGAFLIGISSLFTPYIREAVKTAESIKAYHPRAKIVLGGHHPTSMPKTVMESSAVDFILRGEGEVSISRLARAVGRGGSLEGIPGLVYRRSDGKIVIDDPATMPGLEPYPLPASHLINHSFYKRGRKGSAVIVAGRGCPLKCTYCSVGASSYLKFRKREIASIIGEIETAVKKHDVGFIDFEDENLSLNRRWFLRLLHEIAKRFSGHALEFRAMNGLFPPSLDEEVLAAMKEAGFKTLNLSLGTFSKAQLKRFQRTDVAEAFDHALELAEVYALGAVGYIIIAAPFQRAQSSVSDLLRLAERRVLAAISVFYPAPGSPDYDRCENMGILPKHVACLRSSALPLSHTTTRLEAITLLRLGRILNFMKSLLDMGISLPDPMPAKHKVENPADRIGTGKQLLQYFLHDGKIRGINPEGEIFEHQICTRLSHIFLSGLQSRHIRGCR